MIEEIRENNTLFAVIIRSNYKTKGISFVTANDEPLQIAYIGYPEKKQIKPHIHNYNHREIFVTQEVLFLRKGKLRIDFYDHCKNYMESRIIEAGDVTILTSGGHGFEVLEEIEMIEVKQGPYKFEEDKTRFIGIESDQAKIKAPSNFFTTKSSNLD